MAINDNLTTEMINDASRNIDEMTTHQILQLINNEDKQVAYCVEEALGQIEALVDQIVDALQHHGRLLYIGAGTSGRLGVLDASECVPTFGVSKELVVGIMAGGYEALVTSVEGAEDDETQAVLDLKTVQLSKYDVLIGIAASGRTPYVKKALEYANSIGALTASITCVKNAKLSQIAKYPIEVVVGPEVITGSTRMKAGTATKLVLNMISTTTMIKLGKIYRNLMVDVQPTNSKLVKRAISIIAQCCDINEISAAMLLEKSHNRVKIAILMGLTSLDEEDCEALLEKNHQHISNVIRQLKNEKMNNDLQKG